MNHDMARKVLDHTADMLSSKATQLLLIAEYVDDQEQKLRQKGERIIELQAEMSDMGGPTQRDVDLLKGVIRDYRAMGRKVADIIDSVRRSLGEVDCQWTNNTVRELIDNIATTIRYSRWREPPPFPVREADKTKATHPGEFIVESDNGGTAAPGRMILAGCTREFSHDLDFTHC